MNQADVFLNLIAATSPGGIEEQEKNGQLKLNNSFDRLPRMMRNHRQQLEQLGFVFGGNIDDLFVSVAPPVGWTLQPSDHSMWSYVHDEQGRRRAGVFYKASFYDRKAEMSLDTRYGISRYRACDIDGHLLDLAPGVMPDYVLCVIEDHDKSVVIVIGKRERLDHKQADVLDARAEAWLEENKPDWRNPLAYW